jgi:uncharacterized protein (TIGR02271 family)
MPLQTIANFDSNYRESFEENDIKGMDVYSQGTNEKIGTVSDILVDDQGRFIYLVVDLGVWISGKKPVGRSRIDYNANRIYAVALTRAQADALPEYQERRTLDYDYEEQVRGVYRTQQQPLDATASASMTGASAVESRNPTYNRDSYTYQQEPSLYELNDRDHKTFRLYQERLIANKNRVKTGEVVVGKRVETETVQASVPLEKERVVIERTTPADAGTPVSPSDVDFTQGEVARMEIYEETPEIRKETVVREEVNIRKEVQRDTVEASETLRREKLDVKTEGHPPVELRPDELPEDRV